MAQSSADIGVAIVAYQSAAVIGDCLTSLAASEGARLRVVVVDNDSQDETCQVIRDWAAAQPEGFTFAEASVGKITRAEADLTLLRSPINGGFAYATNRGIEVLEGDPDLPLFWVLNPDCMVRADTAAQYLKHGADGAFSLMGGRTLYQHPADTVQTDGGRVSRLTGVCKPVNLGMAATQTRMPAADTIDFITGANCVASRRFIETVGLMEEDYFLYYEEVDWALRRGDLALRLVPEAVVFHHGGTSIGSGSVDRRPTAFANYFNYRNRMRFVRRHFPLSWPVALAYGMAKSLRLLTAGARSEAYGVFAGLLNLRPPSDVASRIAPDSRELAFGRHGR